MAQHLKRAGSKPSVYESVTARILEALETGVVPWRKSWHEVCGMPCNAVSKRPYHGINHLLLSLARYEDHRWLSFKQAKELGGNVRHGEKAFLAVFWKLYERKTEDATSGKKPEQIPLLRYCPVFNVQQCERLNLPELQPRNISQNERIQAAEEVIQQMPCRPGLHEGCRQACYYPLIDVVQIPSLKSFRTADDYYATLFHELAHATGHESRLNRPGVTKQTAFGSIEYGREELVAELTSGFCCATIGLDNSILENAASYIDSWLSTIRSDSKAVVIAAAQAQRAADYILGGADTHSESD